MFQFIFLFFYFFYSFILCRLYALILLTVHFFLSFSFFLLHHNVPHNTTPLGVS